MPKNSEFVENSITHLAKEKSLDVLWKFKKIVQAWRKQINE